ncbi:MAG: glutathione S-transferase family protein, partial [Gammaproteobacteria bacterium]|nr:glutathione S-transferase family protein [Gammaproteobacteria bacterium]
MGLLVDGQWHDQWYDTDSTGGKFERSESQFRNWVTADGSAGPSGVAGFKAQAGRYHLYVSLACPWAHRTLIFRKLKGLESMISVSVVNPFMREHGWTFIEDTGVVADPLFQATYMHQIYTAADSKYSGRVTVPVLWDKQQNVMVNNESSEIIRMFNSAFDQIGAKPGDYYPEALRAEIDRVNEHVYDTINNGVYKAGFATSQKAYELAVFPLFA